MSNAQKYIIKKREKIHNKTGGHKPNQSTQTDNMKIKSNTNGL